MERLEDKLEQERKETPRTITEQIIRILCIIAFLLTLIVPLIICDVLGSICAPFSAESGIPLTVGEGQSQTRFFFGLIYMLQNSNHNLFIPLQLFSSSVQMVFGASAVNVVHTFYGALILVCMSLFYILPILFYIILRLDVWNEHEQIRNLKNKVVFIAAIFYTIAFAILTVPVLGMYIRFRLDHHANFVSQYFMAYGGVKETIAMAFSALIAIGCYILIVLRKKRIG